MIVMMRRSLPPPPQSSPLGLPTFSQSVISCVRLLCERLLFIEPPDVTDAVFNLRRACKTASHFKFSNALKEEVTQVGGACSHVTIGRGHWLYD